MNDRGIFSFKNLILGAALILQIEKIDIQTLELAGAFDQPSQEIVQEHFEPPPALHALQGRQKLAEEVATNPSPESRDDAPQPQGNEEPPKEALHDILDAVDEFAEKLTETEKDRRSEEPQAILELLQARQADLDALLESQKRDDAEKHAENAEFRKELAERHVGSPDQEKYLQKFDDVVEPEQKDRDGKYAAEVRGLDEQWQQKFKEFDKQPLAIPTVPDRDRDDEGR